MVQNTQFCSSIRKLGMRMSFFHFDPMKYINYFIEEEYPLVNVDGEEGPQPQRQTRTWLTLWNAPQIQIGGGCGG